jgi:leader peptidase (prepilin peptidase)/N-methyltransferase
LGGLAAMALSGKGRDMRIPFGPYLAIGGFVGLLWGRSIVTAYLGFFPG